MRKMLWAGALTLAVLLAAQAGVAGEAMKVVTGKPFESALVDDFYLEGNAIPTQKRNAAMLEKDGGARVVVALLDTSGYGAEIQQKYLGMLITETKLMAGGAELMAGAYGFGLVKPAAEGGAGKILFYDVAGKKVAEGTAPHDAAMAQPAPLKMVTAEGKPARLYLGKHYVELQ
jgi:hypothetical protein